MSENQPQLENLRKLMKETAPDKADDVLKKYKLLMDAASSTLVGDYSKQLGNELVNDTIAQLKNANNEQRNEIINSFEDKLKNMSKAISVDLELLSKKETPLVSDQKIEIQAIEKKHGGTGWKDQGDGSEMGENAVGKKIGRRKVNNQYRYYEWKDDDWKIMGKGPVPKAGERSAEKKNAEVLKNDEKLLKTVDKFLSANDFINLVKELKNNPDNNKLDWLLSKIITLPPEEGTRLPLQYEFYKILIDLVKKRNSASDRKKSVEMKVSDNIILSQLFALRANTELAQRFMPGTEIAFQGIITEVNILTGTYRCNRKAQWYSFSEFNLPSLDRTDAPGSLSSIKDQREDAKRNLTNAQRLVLTKSIQEISLLATINEAHIPKYSLLTKFLKKGWVSIDKNKRIKLSGYCPSDFLNEVYKAILKQIKLEQIYIEEENLQKPKNTGEKMAFDAKKLLLSAKKDLASNDIYSARGKLINFLKLTDTTLLLKDKEIAEYREFAFFNLKVCALTSLQKLNRIASYMFGMDEQFKNFLISLSRLLGRESKRIESLKISDANFSFDGFKNLTLKHWSKSSAFIEDEYEANHLKKYLPPMYSIELWNKIVKLESPSNYENLGNNKELRNEYFTKLADKLRHPKSFTYSFRVQAPNSSKTYPFATHDDRIYHPEAAVFYYREALGDKITEAEFQLMEKRQKIKKLERTSNKEKYLAQAMNYIKQTIKNQKVPQGISETDFEKNKNLLLSDRNILEDISKQFLDAYVDQKVESLVYQKFHEGSLKGQDKKIWEKIDDVKGIYGGIFNPSDRMARFLAKEFVETIFITIASMGIATGASAGIKLALISTKIPRILNAIKTGSLIYRTAMFVAETTSFTLAQTALENKWGSFGKNFGLNLLMFGSLRAGLYTWARVPGKYLVGQRSELKVIDSFLGSQGKINPGSLYLRAGALGKLGSKLPSLGQLGLKSADALGRLGTELTLFTALSTAEKMALENISWDDIDLIRDAGMNLLTILSLRVGGAVVNPLFKPAVQRAEIKATRLLENSDPASFLKNNNLPRDYFAEKLANIPKSDKSAGGETKGQYEAKIREVQLEAMAEYRNFIDSYKLRPDFFQGRLTSGIKKIMAELKSITTTPTADALVNYAVGKYPEIFEILAGKVDRLDFSQEQIRTIASKQPKLLLKFVDKLPEAPRNLLQIAKSFNVSVDLAKSTAKIDQPSTTIPVIEALKSKGFILNWVANGLKVINGAFSYLIEFSANVKKTFANALTVIENCLKSINSSARKFNTNERGGITIKTAIWLGILGIAALATGTLSWGSYQILDFIRPLLPVYLGIVGLRQAHRGNLYSLFEEAQKNINKNAVEKLKLGLSTEDRLTILKIFNNFRSVNNYRREIVFPERRFDLKQDLNNYLLGIKRAKLAKPIRHLYNETTELLKFIEDNRNLTPEQLSADNDFSSKLDAILLSLKEISDMRNPNKDRLGLSKYPYLGSRVAIAVIISTLFFTLSFTLAKKKDEKPAPKNTAEKILDNIPTKEGEKAIEEQLNSSPWRKKR